MKETPWKVRVISVTNYGWDHHIIETNEGEWLVSYNSVIGFKPFDPSLPTCLDEKCWEYSKTTSKYRNIMLGEDTKATRARIKNGEYILLNLNE